MLSGCLHLAVPHELARYPRLNQLQAWMTAAGLEAFEVVTVEAAYEITSARPYKDRVYSALHLIPPDAWRAGLARLERDLARGPVRGISRYACVWGYRL